MESDTIESLILDLLEWIGPDARPYADVIAAWRTSCPRFPVWEVADERGLITRHYQPGIGSVISVADRGRQLLDAHRPHRNTPDRLS